MRAERGVLAKEGDVGWGEETCLAKDYVAVEED